MDDVHTWIEFVERVKMEIEKSARGSVTSWRRWSGCSGIWRAIFHPVIRVVGCAGWPIWRAGRW